MKKQNKKEEINEMLEELEKIIKDFEKGTIDIDKGIDKYKEAAKLIKRIKEKLESKKLVIEEIKESY